MPSLLYHWNFTVLENLSLGQEILDEESNLIAKVKRRGTYDNSNFETSINGIFLDNNDSTNGGYYIELDGLNTVQWGGNISIEMVITNNDLNKKSLYFSSTNSDTELTSDGATLVARFNKSKTRFLARPVSSSTAPYNQLNPPYRNVNIDSDNVVSEGSEHHYIFSLHYESSTDSNLKIFIDGDKKSENPINLGQQLTDDVRGSNIIGTNKDPTNTTYLNGIVKYIKIYQGSTSISDAINMFNNFSTSSYSWEDYSSESDANKYLRRHTHVNNYFTNDSSISSFSSVGKQLGLSNSSATYKIHKFENESTIEISNNFNYIPLNTKDNFIILNYDSLYFKITQTSEENGIEAKYKLEISSGDTSNFTLQFEEKQFGYVFTYNNVTIILGGVEFNFTDTNPPCFHENTIIDTDQGKVKVKDLTNNYTINNCKVVSVFAYPEKPKKLVLIKKNALGKYFPMRDILITHTHDIYIHNRYIPIYKLINNKTILTVNNDNSFVYSIIVLNKKTINVGNLYLGVIYFNEKRYNSLLRYKRKGMKKINIYIIGYSSNNTRELSIDLTKF